MMPSGAGASTQSVDKPLEVKGQTRSWNRFIRVKKDREVIDFVQARRNYHKEIESTQF